MRVAAIGLLAFTTACGGLVADYADASPTADVATPRDALAADAAQPPPPVRCTPHSGTGFGNSNGSCGTTSEWTCGADTYRASCTCPDRQCICTKNGTRFATLPFSGCPSCSASAEVGTLCPFPQ